MEESEDSGDGKAEIVGGVGRAVGEGGAVDSEAGAGERPEIQAAAGRRAQTAGPAEGVCGGRVCLAHGLPVVGPAQGIRERESRPQIFFGMEAARSFCPAVAEGVGGVCRAVRDCLGLAKH